MIRILLVFLLICSCSFAQPAISDSVSYDPGAMRKDGSNAADNTILKNIDATGNVGIDGTLEVGTPLDINIAGNGDGTSTITSDKVTFDADIEFLGVVTGLGTMAMEAATDYVATGTLVTTLADYALTSSLGTMAAEATTDYVATSTFDAAIGDIESALAAILGE